MYYTGMQYVLLYFKYVNANIKTTYNAFNIFQQNFCNVNYYKKQYINA